MGGRDIEGRVRGMGLPPLHLTSGNGLVGLSSHQLIMQVSEKLSRVARACDAPFVGLL